MAKKHLKQAVALIYDRDTDEAPKVTAKGQGLVAEKIIEIAQKHGVPIKEDPDLMAVLSTLDINEQIPSEIYVAVAELLAFVYAMNKQRPKKS